MTSSVVSIGSGDHHVLAVHGWFGSARGWGSLPDYVDRSAYTWAFMDLRGYGERKQVPGEFSITEAATDAVALAGLHSESEGEEPNRRVVVFPVG